MAKKWFEKDISIEEARKTIKEALEKDPELEWAYVSNVAMVLHDRYGITDFIELAKATKEILKVLFY